MPLDVAINHRRVKKLDSAEGREKSGKTKKASLVQAERLKKKNLGGLSYRKLL